MPEEVFLALELAPGGLAGITGVVRYAPEFAEVCESRVGAGNIDSCLRRRVQQRAASSRFLHKFGPSRRMANRRDSSCGFRTL